MSILDPFSFGEYIKAQIEELVRYGMEAKMKEQFDFDFWWETVVEHYSVPTTNHICALQPLYDKMKEWGFDSIYIQWDMDRILVGRHAYPKSCEWILDKHFYFKDICDFPRALKEAFKWMHANRINREKKKCTKDGPCDTWKEYRWNTDYFREYDIANNVASMKYCPFCGEKR